MAPDLLEEPVARTKPQPPPEPEDRERKPMAIQVRGNPAWKTWAEELARFDGLSLASLVDRSLRRYAREIGFGKEPPER